MRVFDDFLDISVLPDDHSLRNASNFASDVGVFLVFPCLFLDVIVIRMSLFDFFEVFLLIFQGLFVFFSFFGSSSNLGSENFYLGLRSFRLFSCVHWRRGVRGESESVNELRDIVFESSSFGSVNRSVRFVLRYNAFVIELGVNLVSLL